VEVVEVVEVVDVWSEWNGNGRAGGVFLATSLRHHGIRLRSSRCLVARLEFENTKRKF
jgi:hypothetical protein